MRATGTVKRKYYFILFVVGMMCAFPSHHVTKAQEPTPGVLVLPTPAEVINAVNALRLSYGILPLAVHPALTQIAQLQADGIASGSDGHWRPAGMSLGQWMMSLGYPLSGDLSLDGYRSENWVAAGTAQDAINAWLSDDLHTNTMLSTERSDIGAGVSTDGEQIYVVIETALQTRSGQMQSNAYPTLTALAGAPVNSTSSNSNDGSSQYMLPIALNTAMPNGDVYHEVKYGQTLWSIAVNYHTTIKQIQQWNNLQSNIINEGQKLLVIKGATQPAPESAVSLATLPAMVAIPTSLPTATIPATPTATIEPIFNYSGQGQRENVLVIGSIAAAAILLGGVFAVMTKKKPI
ncbi:MAG: LysM peptidoglycan-binding domain-containing protein [Anaerolineales bacterium]